MATSHRALLRGSSTALRSSVGRRTPPVSSSPSIRPSSTQLSFILLAPGSSKSLFHTGLASQRPSRDPLQAEREANTVAGNRLARAQAEKQHNYTGGNGGPRDDDKQNRKGRISEAWKSTPIKWYPIPILLGAVVLVGVQARRNYIADRDAQEGSKGKIVDENGQVITMSGPWTVYVLGALPLNAISRLWGWANGLTLPVWFRPYGFRLYSAIFGCNLDEMDDPDLTHYKSLGEFFYRHLKPNARAIDEEAPIVSPADGTVLHFGTIKGRQVEQVKGLTYSLDALLGLSSAPQDIDEAKSEPGSSMDEKQFAAINGIDYSLDRLLGDERKRRSSRRITSWTWWKSWVVKQNTTGVPASSDPQRASETATKDIKSEQKKNPLHRPSSEDDEGTEPSEAGVETPDSPEILSRYASVAYEMGSGALPPILQRHSPGQEGVAEGNKLHFAVIYLAPGDYHHFHSPTNWVVERRRHFRGELYSVSPYIASRLSNLFILNERVALLGRWRYGFFSMIPVGATNVGSIKINFDTELRTNLREQRPLAGTYSEATYNSASRLLGGQPLSKGEEMGGFLLGSTVVLVWESPDFAFEIEPGQKIKMGEKLGDLGDSEMFESKEQISRKRKLLNKFRNWWFF
ncbi:unnamed protein product [Sympodiomycopsis kandeliae]